MFSPELTRTSGTVGSLYAGLDHTGESPGGSHRATGELKGFS